MHVFRTSELPRVEVIDPLVVVYEKSFVCLDLQLVLSSLFAIAIFFLNFFFPLPWYHLFMYEFEGIISICKDFLLVFGNSQYGLLFSVNFARFRG
jgi:hypothetical protein